MEAVGQVSPFSWRVEFGTTIGCHQQMARFGEDVGVIIKQTSIVFGLITLLSQ